MDYDGEVADKLESCRYKQYLLFLKELSDETTCWIYFRNLSRRFQHGRAVDRADRVCQLQVLNGGRSDGIQVQARLHQALLQDGLGEVQGGLHEALLQEGLGQGQVPGRLHKALLQKGVTRSFSHD